MGGGGAGWRFTGVYGEARSDLRENSWRTLRSLNVQPTQPWLCAGDFNEILYAHEKQGGNPKRQACMDKFKEALVHCELHDLGFQGDMFTWRNHCHSADGYIKERLDRAVANDAWRGRFPAVKVINGDPRHSDHRPLIISTSREDGGKRTRRKGGCFQFEASWLEEEKCGQVVLDSWKGAFERGASTCHEALEGVGKGLMDWSRNVLGDLEKRLKYLKKI